MVEVCCTKQRIFRLLLVKLDKHISGHFCKEQGSIEPTLFSTGKLLLSLGIESKVAVANLIKPL